MHDGATGTMRKRFAQLATRATQATGSYWAFAFALGVVLVWALTGPIFGFSDTWQLVINTGTTVITFLMVFLIQHAQNRDVKALHVKLNELVAAIDAASNRIIDVEDLSEEELDALEQRYRERAETLRQRGDVAEARREGKQA